jgi:hypothetical protein
LNTFLYNWKEERNDEVNKREKNTSTTTTTTAATIIPTHSIRDNTQNFFPWEEARKRPDRCRWKRRVQHYY